MSKPLPLPPLLLLPIGSVRARPCRSSSAPAPAGLRDCFFRQGPPLSRRTCSLSPGTSSPPSHSPSWDCGSVRTGCSGSLVAGPGAEEEPRRLVRCRGKKMRWVGIWGFRGYGGGSGWISVSESGIGCALFLGSSLPLHAGYFLEFSRVISVDGSLVIFCFEKEGTGFRWGERTRGSEPGSVSHLGSGPETCTSKSCHWLQLQRRVSNSCPLDIRPS
jgi:hypothetical protein